MTTGPTDGKVTTPAGGPGGMPLALSLSEGLDRAFNMEEWITMKRMTKKTRTAIALCQATRKATLKTYPASKSVESRTSPERQEMIGTEQTNRALLAPNAPDSDGLQSAP